MLEVINGFLLVYFLILCILSALAPNMVKPISSLFFKPSREERNIWSQLQKLKEDQSAMSIKDEFAAYSKLQRKINKLESDLKSCSQDRLNKKLAIKSSVTIGLQGVIGLILVVSMVMYRREPLILLKGNLFPLTTILRYPSEIQNSISAHVWVLVSNYSIRTLIKPLTC